MARLILYGQKPGGDWEIYRDFEDFYHDVRQGHMSTHAMGLKIKEHRRGAQADNPDWNFGLGTKKHKPIGWEGLDKPAKKADSE